VVSRAGLILALAFAATGCGVEGATCGRGRCGQGTICISTFGDSMNATGGRQNQGWMESHYPNVLNEWWCERLCPPSKVCPGNCLEDPADDSNIVCATDSVHVTFITAGRSCLCTPTHSCNNDSEVTGMDITDRCTPTHTVLKTCSPNEECDGGTFKSGDQVPGLRLYQMNTNLELLYCPGLPSNTFGPELPEGKTLTVYADNSACP
jgi:hypothetical protein